MRCSILRPVALPPGVRLGPYEIVALIGAGGMGEVYRAHDPRLGRDVAIKVAREQFSDRFLREARAVASLNHPHICTLYDVGPNYLVMEHIDGAPLAGPLTPEETLRVGLQIASALAEAHRKGVVHRDLKPANILLTASGVKLLDFGLAKLERAPDEATVTATAAGTVLGTAAYMAPEQALGTHADSRSDIFSFGSVLYEMLSGRRAFQGDSAVAVMAAVVSTEPLPLRAAPSLAQVVTRCMRKAPAERFANALEVEAALRRVDLREATKPSIAVLPFVNLSPDKENEYFSDGLTEEIINVLAHVSGLKVIARASAFTFRGKESDFRAIADTLGVSTILQGSVRRSGSSIRITAQLIGAEDGSLLWSERYSRELVDVFAIQDDIAAAIAAALELRLAGQASVRRYTPTLPAYDARLKARFHEQRLTPESMAKARTCFEQAIALDPDYALPLAEFGGFFFNLANFGMMPAHEAMPLARAFAQRALTIDPSLPDAHTVLGMVAGEYEYDWNEAHRQFQLAMAGRPLAPGVRRSYGLYFLFFVGRALEAATEIARALEDDPLNLRWRFDLSFCYVGAGRDEEAATELRRVLEIDDLYHLAYFELAVIEACRGRLAEALALIERAYELAPFLLGNAGLRAGLLIRNGDDLRGRETLQTLGDGHEYGAPLAFLLFHLVCLEFDKAAVWAQRGLDQRDPAILFFLRSPIAEGLRSGPRWPALAAMMNFVPELPQSGGP